MESREKAPDWDALSDLKYEKRGTKLGTEQGAWRTGRTAVILNRTSWRRQQNRGCQSRARGGRVGYALVSFLFFDSGMCPGELFRKISKSHSEGPNVASCKISSKKEKRKESRRGGEESQSRCLSGREKKVSGRSW